jgi:hypothetical protein
MVRGLVNLGLDEEAASRDVSMCYMDMRFAGEEVGEGSSSRSMTGRGCNAARVAPATGPAKGVPPG